MEEIFVAHSPDMQRRLNEPLSMIVPLYEQTRSFAPVAEHLSLNRAAVRRLMREASTALLAKRAVKAQAAGAYMFALVDRSDASGTGLSKRERKKDGTLYHRDPGC